MAYHLSSHTRKQLEEEGRAGALLHTPAISSRPVHEGQHATGHGARSIAHEDQHATGHGVAQPTHEGQHATGHGAGVFAQEHEGQHATGHGVGATTSSKVKREAGQSRSSLEISTEGTPVVVKEKPLEYQRDFDDEASQVLVKEEPLDDQRDLNDEVSPAVVKEEPRENVKEPSDEFSSREAKYSPWMMRSSGEHTGAANVSSADHHPQALTNRAERKRRKQQVRRSSRRAVVAADISETNAGAVKVKAEIPSDTDVVDERDVREQANNVQRLGLARRCNECGEYSKLYPHPCRSLCKKCSGRHRGRCRKASIPFQGSVPVQGPVPGPAGQHGLIPVGGLRMAFNELAIRVRDHAPGVFPGDWLADLAPPEAASEQGFTRAEVFGMVMDTAVNQQLIFPQQQRQSAEDMGRVFGALIGAWCDVGPQQAVSQQQMQPQARPQQQPQMYAGTGRKKRKHNRPS